MALASSLVSRCSSSSSSSTASGAEVVDSGGVFDIQPNGSVFDVRKGRSNYGPGGGYHHFAGRDASRAFVSRNFTGDGLTDSLQGLSTIEVNSIADWRKFYFERYMFGAKQAIQD